VSTLSQNEGEDAYAIKEVEPLHRSWLFFFFAPSEHLKNTGLRVATSICTEWGKSEMATADSQLEDQHQWRKRDHVKNSDRAAASVRFFTGAAVTSFIWQNVLCFHYLGPDCLTHRGVKSTEKLYWRMSTLSKVYSLYPKTYLSESTKVCTCNCTWYLKVNYFLALEIKTRDCVFLKTHCKATQTVQTAEQPV